MSSNNLGLDETKIDSKDGDIPFILCTPTKNDNDEVDVLASFDAEEPPRHKFFLKPRRSCKCTLGFHHEQNNMSTEPTWNDGDSDRNLSDEQLERNSSSSPMPTLSFDVDVMVTPPVINLMKRQRPSHSQEEKKEEGNDDGDNNSSSKMLPLFPSIGRQQQSQHQHPPALRRPIARHPR